jgi:hypothetical protein
VQSYELSPAPDLIRGTEIAYKAQSPGKSAQHNKAQGSGDKVNAAVVQRRLTLLNRVPFGKFNRVNVLIRGDLSAESVGGGLIRSLGGWSQVLSIRRDNQRVLTDERILGTGDFVDRILNEADERLKYQMAGKQIGEVIEQVCEEENINSHELRMGSRRRRISQVRAQTVHQPVENFGIPLAEVARQVGVSTSAVSKALNRTMKN